jgi:hypothetical protein
MGSDTFRKLTDQERLFTQWWGRYVMTLTHEELMAGAASSVTIRAAEAAWMASAFIWQQRHGTDPQQPAR